MCSSPSAPDFRCDRAWLNLWNELRSAKVLPRNPGIECPRAPLFLGSLKAARRGSSRWRATSCGRMSPTMVASSSRSRRRTAWAPRARRAGLRRCRGLRRRRRGRSARSCGRTANRIAGGRIVIDGTAYELSRNENDATLHGGVVEFGKQFWRVETADAAERGADAGEP